MRAKRIKRWRTKEKHHLFTAHRTDSSDLHTTKIDCNVNVQATDCYGDYIYIVYTFSLFIQKILWVFFLYLIGSNRWKGTNFWNLLMKIRGRQKAVSLRTCFHSKLLAKFLWFKLRIWLKRLGVSIICFSRSSNSYKFIRWEILLSSVLLLRNLKHREVTEPAQGHAKSTQCRQHTLTYRLFQVQRRKFKQVVKSNLEYVEVSVYWV